MDNTTYRNSSVIMAGFAGLVFLCNIVANIVGEILSPEEYNAIWRWMYPVGPEESNAIWRWMVPVCSLATPVLFGWIGMLLRYRYPRPCILVKILLFLMIPLIYIMWTVLHMNGICRFGDGRRCAWLFMAIIFYLIPTGVLERYSRENGLLELVLFFGAAFCYMGIARVVNHFSVANFQMLDGEWTRLFSRAMRFVPLAMSVFFLAAFSFSGIGQKIGSLKGMRITVLVLSVISFCVLVSRLFYLGFYFRLYNLYRVLAQPVTVCLFVVFVRLMKVGMKNRKLIFRDIFKL